MVDVGYLYMSVDLTHAADVRNRPLGVALEQKWRSMLCEVRFIDTIITTATKLNT
jgi:hypothetical protein